MPDGLYEQDALAWAERQSDLLRRVAAGERLNEDVDWEHVIEEIHDVGLSELHACQSFLHQALLHLLKLNAEPESQAALHWRGEIRGFLATARRRFTPSMRQRIVLDDLFADALWEFRDDPAFRKNAPRPCPFTLDDLISVRPDVSDLLAQLGES